MPHDVTMPQLGMAQDAGKIVSWLKAEGDAVAKGDALLEVETDKAVMEVEANADGFLTGVVAAAGEDVPVGQVIARISESADAGGAEDAPASGDRAASAPVSSGSDDDLPDGKRITMPQLGMAQDSGVLVDWHKAPGDAVEADDVLFEVETDKSTMEVNAGVDGYLAATLAEPGDDVPVGEPVAIISAEKPANPVARKMGSAGKPAPAAGASGKASPAPAPQSSPQPEPRAGKAPAKTMPSAAPAARSSDGRILASPKARRLAMERGLDLGRLVEAGHPQPYHVADLEILADLPDTRAASGAAAAAPARQVSAIVASDGLSDFVAWAAKAHDLKDTDALLAGLAGASLPRDGRVTGPITVAIERFGVTRSYAVPMSPALSEVIPGDGTPDLIIRDLRGTAIRAAHLGAEGAPTITLMPSDNAAMALTLECGAAQLDASSAIQLLSQFAGRLEQPLRHLL